MDLWRGFTESICNDLFSTEKVKKCSETTRAACYCGSRGLFRMSHHLFHSIQGRVVMLRFNAKWGILHVASSTTLFPWSFTIVHLPSCFQPSSPMLTQQPRE